MAFATINKGSSYFNTILYTGNGSNNYSVTGNDFSADFIWIKCRSAALTNHHLTDIIRGFGTGSSNTPTLNSDSTSAEYQRNIFSSTGVTSTGFSLNNYSDTNTNAATYAAWCWDANGTGVSNTAGTISSTVSANTTAGFSIVSYTGNATAGATVGHGLGVAPRMIIIKPRTITENWATYHASLGNANNVTLNTTNASGGTSDYNSTSPTSTVFSLGSGSGTNGNGNTIIAYCFADVKGYSKFGSYVGNGNANGTFIYTGFRPSFFLIKNTTTAGNGWHIFDNKRIGFNTSNYQLSPNDSGAEDTTTGYTDILSNGFKMRSTNDFNNKNGDTYIYMAFAENPFVLTDGTPVTAR